MRTFIRISLVTLFALTLGATQASANTVSWTWTGTSGTGTTGSNSIDANNGDILTGVVIHNIGATGLSLHATTIEFNLGDNELGFVSCAEPGIGGPAGTGAFYVPLAAGCGVLPPSANLPNGGIGTLDQSATGAAASMGTLLIATVVFSVENVAPDGDDLWVGTFQTTIDGIVNGVFGLEIPSGVALAHGSVNGVPEPGTASLLALGLGALALTGGRRRR